MREEASDVRRLPDEINHFRVVVGRFSREQRLEIVRLDDPLKSFVHVAVALRCQILDIERTLFVLVRHGRAGCLQ